MSAISAVRIWGNATVSHLDYLTLKLAAVLPKYSEPGVQVSDRLGRSHLIEPPSSVYRQYVTGLAITFPARYCTLLNNQAADTRRWLSAWLEYYVNEIRQELFIYTKTVVKSHAQPGETTIANQNVYRCYRGRAFTAPPELLGMLNSVGNSLPPYVTLEMNITDQGTFSDWAKVADSAAWTGR